MGITYLSGILKPARPVYFPGGPVTGVVRIHLDSNTSIRNLFVELTGKGEVRWTEGSGEHSTTYWRNETYCQQKLTVWQGAEYGGEMLAGVYEYPFSFNLPHNIPSCFEAPHGHVRYTVTSTADRKLRFDTTHKFLLSISTLYDLNINPIARSPFTIDKSDSSCILCCSSGPVHVTLYSDRSGFVPGEKMIVNGEVHNRGSMDVESTHLEIIQVIVHKARKTKTSYRAAQTVTRGGVEGGRSVAWSSVVLAIPAVVPSGLSYCNIIDVSYIVKFSAKFGMCRAVSETQPIIIGSIPFSSGPEAQHDLKAIPMPTWFQLYGSNGQAGGTTSSVSYTTTGPANTNISYNGQEIPYGESHLYVASSLFSSPTVGSDAAFCPSYAVYAAAPVTQSVDLHH